MIPENRMYHPAPPILMSPLNYHCILQALGTHVPKPSLDQALTDQALDSRALRPVDQHRCVNVTTSLSFRHGDRLMLARGFSQLHAERRFFPSMRKPPGDVLATLLQYKRYLTQNTGLGQMALSLGATHSHLYLQRHPHFATSDGHAWSLLYSSSRLLERFGLPRSAMALSLHEQPGAQERQEIRTLFDMDVTFGTTGDALIIDNAFLLRATPAEVPLSLLGGLERRLRRQQPELSWSDSVRALLPMVLSLPGAPLTLCASLLAMGERTLQRRIKSEHQSFRGLLHESRRQLANQLLVLPQLSADQLAARLGYQQSAQFYRAYRSWFGESPGRARAG